MAVNHQKNNESFTLISNRLRLAKNLLEESDKLPGAEAYRDFGHDSTLPHERHERESVVIYLLLTCLDLLGQTGKHLPFSNWLNSKKEEYVNQRDTVLCTLGPCVDPIEASNTLLNAYNKIHGVTNSFYRGINNLSKEARSYLLSSIQISKLIPDPEDSKKERREENDAIETQDLLKIKYLFSLRNSFTHSLAQHHTSSAPMMSIFGNETNPELANKPRASWGFFVGEGIIAPWSSNRQRQGNFLYSSNDLIIVLLELLYNAIGEEFNQDDLNINFFIFSSKGVFFPLVPSKDLDTVLKSNFGVTRPRWKNQNGN